MNQQQYPQNVAPAGHRTATWDWNGANTSGAFLLEARTLRSCADKQPDSKTEVVFEKGGIRAFPDVEQQKIDTFGRFNGILVRQCGTRTETVLSRSSSMPMVWHSLHRGKPGRLRRFGTWLVVGARN